MKTFSSHRKNSALLLVTLACCCCTYAQSTCTGVVQDEKSHAAIAYAYVAVTDASFAVVAQGATDTAGAFSLKSEKPLGRGYLIVQPPAPENKDGIGEDAVSVVVSDAVVYMPLEDLVDREKEIERLKKEQERLAKEIARCQGMLSNPNFVNKAPEAKVNAEKEKLQKYEEMMEKVNTQLKQMDK